MPGLCTGTSSAATVAHGKIVSIDTAEALKLPGVLTVFTHENQPKTAWLDKHWQDAIAPAGSPMRYLHGTDISYSMQPVALVVAESFETARAAARLVKVEYKESPHKTDLAAEMADARPPRAGRRGSSRRPSPAATPDKAYAAAPHQVDATTRCRPRRTTRWSCSPPPSSTRTTAR